MLPGGMQNLMEHGFYKSSGRKTGDPLEAQETRRPFDWPAHAKLADETPFACMDHAVRAGRGGRGKQEGETVAGEGGEHQHPSEANITHQKIFENFQPEYRKAPRGMYVDFWTGWDRDFATAPDDEEGGRKGRRSGLAGFFCMSRGVREE